MGIRRQIHLDETDDKVLQAASRRTGLSASELVRRAIHACYGGGQKLSWDEVFAQRVVPGSGRERPHWDPLFDDESLDERAS
ncbi:MAG: ribbon-helix-helix protein, CopG family [Chloroflexi bacterium]|nr:ribbon-helix-helix protein, CopG family [Chloroflexota bacterium]MBI4507174.1 ribbon-helix-helix protein, CopG family [Chloroflexota bacterium]